MASAAPAYRYDYSRQTAPRPERRTRVEVVPGRRSAESISPRAVALVKLFMMALSIMAVVACVRIGLAAATVNTMIQSEDISSQVDEMRSGSSDLEVRESALSTPSYVKNVAEGQLNMAQPEQTATITLAPDVVAYDASGNLSLSASLAAAAQG
jgi:cell division protein FtsL